MEIRALELENVKSYERGVLNFSRGTNAICGPNGAGKSTILESIGYALFDVPPCRPISGFVREGEKTGTITVTVLADDEREYQIVRRFGARNQHYVYDAEIGQKLAEGVPEVLSWLGEQFGVDDPRGLAALFHDAVGVPQGLLTAAFLLAPERRRAVFNPLLRVEEYNLAWEKLRDTRAALSERLTALQTEIAGLEARAQALPELEAKAAALTADLERAQARLSELAGQLAGLDRQKQALEAARQRLQALAEEATRLDERIAGLAAQVELARQAVDAARQAEAIVREAQPGHQSYLQAKERREQLEAEAQERARQQRDLDERRAEQRVKADRIHRLEMELEVAKTQAAAAEELRPRADEQERLERQLAQAQALAGERVAAETRLEQERARLSELLRRIDQVSAGLAARAAAAQQLEEQERALEALNEALRQVRADEAKHSAILDQLQAQSDTLSALQQAQCPVCEGDLPPQRRDELLARNARQRAQHQELLAGLQSKAGDLVTQGRRIAQAQRHLQRQLSELPREDEHAALQADRDRLRGTVLELEREVARLAVADAQARAIAEQLAALGNPRQAYQSALAIAAQSTALARNLEVERSAALVLQTEVAGLEARLAAFTGLDDDLAAARAEMITHEPAHQRYLQHQREAGELASRQAHLDRQQDELTGAQKHRKALERNLKRAQSAFRPDEYERASQAHLMASAECARVEAQAAMQRSQLEEALASIQELQELAGRLQCLQEELGSWQAVGQLLDFMRRVLKEAGPQVTAALVEVISHQAGRLYADIMSDQAGRLRWSEDYEVLVEHGGRERAFAQLSGGEQMVAALAVRLALLREVSEIDLVFLDEPTSNLDDTRRDNLATQILGIRDFGQLFVVSHDDTFERATDHTVRVEKVGGLSQVIG
ncbi:MAG: SMC family ATPase [Anaerolineae bacterium]|nr:SMC family ATPase [Anaerolineae bacterium]